MKTIKYLFLFRKLQTQLLFLSIIFSIYPITFIQAQNIGFVNVTAGNLRHKPEGEKIMHLPYGTTLNLLGYENSWYHIAVGTDNIKGYIHESIVSLNKLEQKSIAAVEMPEMEVTQSNFEDSYIIREDGAPEPYLFMEDRHRLINEAFEYRLYWNKDVFSTKHFLFNLDAVAERIRKGTYQHTPVELFNESKSYQLTADLYNNEAETTPTYRKFNKPKIKDSFFSEKPNDFLIADIIQKKDTSILGLYASAPKFTQLLKIYFKERNSFQLERQNNIIQYTSSQKIKFFTTDENGNNLISNSGTISYFPGDYRSICILNLEKPVNHQMKYAYFMDEHSMNKHLEHKIKIIATKKIINGYFEFDVFEFDFNADGIIDLLRSFEDCPEDAGDSRDEVLYFNVKGEWKSKLISRSWCNP